MRFFAFVFVAACGSTSAVAPAANTATTDRPDPIVRERYVGVHVGIEVRHLGAPGSRQRLPAGLEQLTAINTADAWHFTVARDGDDLAILLIDDSGVVVDDATLIDRGSDTVIVGDCPDAFIGVAPAGACETAETAEIDVGWRREGRALIQLGPETCSCDLWRL